jgi:hypothetical protein
MRRFTPVLLSLCLVSSLAATMVADGIKQPQKKCPKKLADCPDDGCSTGREIDGNLNRLKNITDDNPEAQGEPEPHTLTWMKELGDPQHFEMGGSREELEQLGEGKLIRVTALLLTAKREGAESCNCQLDDAKVEDKDEGVNTDNHLVLVSRSTVQKFPLPDGANFTQWKNNLAKRERESVTMEFTPRVRLDHPNFTRAAVRPLILEARQLALLVRVTGLLMFDSQHFKDPLVRVNNWEIHPILKLEFCPKGATCHADGDEGWESLDDQ